MPPYSPSSESVMAPSNSSSRPGTSSKHGARISERKSKSREATPTSSRSDTGKGKMVEGDAQLASKFKSDLISMKGLVTCSICDQLLYEPWTLACGHTYCYSCLCSWFVPNKRKKTCPECRSPVKQIPAPAFLVKQMVEIFINRSELMPSDESIEQHKTKRAEELEIVDKDKNSPEGLFKGTFPQRHGELWRDEADGVMRCPACGHEHEGGPLCESCGAEFDDMYGFSDGDEDGNLSDIDIGEIELEMGADFGEAQRMHHHRNHPFYEASHFPRIPDDLIHHYHHHFGNLVDDEAEDDEDEDEDPSTSEMSDEQENSDDDEDAGSLENFVVQDEDNEPPRPSRRSNRRVITISDDDESDDEGGAITNRRRQRPGWNGGRRASETPSVAITVTEDESSTNGSEFGDDDTHEARMVLRASGGWSPLDEGDDDIEGLVQYDGYRTTEDERATDESDTETIGNIGSDAEDDDRSRDRLSQTPRYQTPDYNRTRYPSSAGDVTPSSYASENEYPYDYDDPDDQSTNMDRDGDTEMSVSPSASRSSRSVSVESYGYGRGEDLGVANEFGEFDGDSSDSSIRPPPRRQPRHDPLVQQYDPRISMLFAEHQLTMRDTQNPATGLDGLDSEMRRIEPASRGRRRLQYNYHNPTSPRINDATDSLHHLIPPRGVDLARSPRGLPSGRVIASSSSRPNRPQRQYHR
ncbi:E3 ubiquitin ligase [Clarireedia jacksonii]